jgi:DNA-binding HxlR family transcriptional regulator
MSGRIIPSETTKFESSAVSVMKKKTYDCAVGCPVEATLDVIGGKWKAVVLYHLMSGTLRFNEIRKRLNGITQRMLTKQLRELEEAGLIARKIYPVVPPKVEYSLTKKGLTLRPVIRALEVWGEDHLSTMGGKFRRAA